MLGYIRIRKDDLKIKDYNTYKQKYCGLCQRLGKEYGFLYRMIVSYDMVFLMLCLENFENDMQREKIRCPLNPIKKIHADVSENVIRYCAFMNYYLTIIKLEDDVLDERNSTFKKILLKMFTCNVKYNKIKESFGDKINAISKIMDEIRQLEKINANFDIVSNSFGRYFVEILKLYLDYINAEPINDKDDLYSLCFNLGKWIYMIDAYDDYEQDMKEEKFNLLSEIISKDESEKKEIAHKKIHILNEMLIFKMRQSFNKIQWNKHGDIIYNLINFGCMDIYMGIVNKKYPHIIGMIK